MGDARRPRIATKLGDLLALARELKGWTQRELSRRSGINHTVIAQVETGYIKEPSFRVIVALGTTLGLSFERLAEAARRPEGNDTKGEITCGK